MRILHTQLIRTRRLHSQPVISMNVSAAAAPRAWRYVAVNPFRHVRPKPPLILHWNHHNHQYNQPTVCAFLYNSFQSPIYFTDPNGYSLVWAQRFALCTGQNLFCCPLHRERPFVQAGLLSHVTILLWTSFVKKRNEVWISLSSRLNWVIYVPMSLLLVIIICHMCLYWDEMNPRV